VVINEGMMLPGSNLFEAAMTATAYSDFTARFVKLQYDTQERGVDHYGAIQDALDMFIYYDAPDNKYLQYANDHGFAMFTKFYMRIQQIIGRTMARHPLSMAAVFAAQQVLPDGVMQDNIIEYFVDPEKALNRFHPGPFFNALDSGTEIPLLRWLNWFNPL
jgi:hypothetical protein